MSGLTLKAVRKSYGTHEILHGIDLEVNDGEFVVLVGPSGCGKSTLLRMIAGLDTVTTGELEIGGKQLTHVSPQKRNIAMVFQSYALFPHLKVRKNISFGMELRGLKRTVIEEKIREAANVLNLTDYLDRYPRELSGGQRQRVAMARAIVREPSLYLMDEPLSNLDAQLRVKMRAEIKALHQRLGNTIVYVTHDQVEAMTLADRLVIMRAGKIEQQGRPLDLYDRPANTFVANFLGSPAINLMDGSLVAGALQVSGCDEKWGLASNLTARELAVGVRPDKCFLSDEGIPGKVHLVENMGSEAVVHIETEGGLLRLLANERLTAKIGDPVCVGFDAGNVLLFDKDSGDAIQIEVP